MIDEQEGHAGAAPDVSVVIVTWNTRDLLLRGAPLAVRRDDFRDVRGHRGRQRLGGRHKCRRQPPVPERSTDRTGRRTAGFTGGNNVGFDVARGRYVLLLNSDTVVLPTTVEPLVRFLDEHPRAGTAGARHLNADGSLQRSMDDVPTSASGRALLHRALPLAGDPPLAEPAMRVVV
jgi:hypothetical protein